MRIEFNGISKREFNACWSLIYKLNDQSQILIYCNLTSEINKKNICTN